MLESDKVFAGSVPENYGCYMVPLIFEPYAADLAWRAASLSPGAVLETCAGTGVVARALAPKLSPGATYVEPTSTSRCSTTPPGDRLPTVASAGVKRMLWRCRLKTPPSILFAVNSGRCSFPTAHPPTAKPSDPKPGGYFLFSVWDRIEENVFADDVTKALARIFPNDPPRFLARTPHGYHDTAQIRRELEDAGFSG